MAFDDKALRRLADAVSVRRARLGVNQEALPSRGGPSGRTIRDIETARLTRITPATLAKLDRALAWRDGTAEKILAGTATEEDLSTVAVRADSPLYDTPARPASDSDGLEPGDRRPLIGWPTVTLVTELLARLAQDEARSPEADDAMKALHKLLPELWSPTE